MFWNMFSRKVALSAICKVISKDQKHSFKEHELWHMEEWGTEFQKLAFVSALLHKFNIILWIMKDDSFACLFSFILRLLISKIFTWLLTNFLCRARNPQLFFLLWENKYLITDISNLTAIEKLPDFIHYKLIWSSAVLEIFGMQKKVGSSIHILFIYNLFYILTLSD